MPDRITDELKQKCRSIVEVLPYIRKFEGKTFVVKYGGSAMIDETIRNQIITDLVLMKYVGMNPVLIHGGGKEISQMMNKLHKKPEFIEGLRVTDKETMDIVEMVLVGKINKELVSLINMSGAKAVGISGKDGNLINAEKHPPVMKYIKGRSKEIELGLVGRITSIKPDIILKLQNADYIPVIAPTSMCEDGSSLNINGDLAAGEIAAALGASKLMFLTDQRGILKDENDTYSILSELDISEVHNKIEEGIIKGGMLPKVEAAIRALEGGVESVHIIDGRIEHSLLLECFTDSGIGTMITP